MKTVNQTTAQLAVSQIANVTEKQRVKRIIKLLQDLDNTTTTLQKIEQELSELLETLTRLDLWSKNIGVKGAKALAAMLEKKTTLTILYLSDNNIGDEGAKALAAMLKKNTTITNLGLSHNSIGVGGAIALAAMLENKTTLTSLDLRDNKIGDEGAKALAAMLKENTTLTTLNLGVNDIGVEGGEALAAMLEHNTTLTSLNLETNHIGAEISSKIDLYLERNKLLAKQSKPTTQSLPLPPEKKVSFVQTPKEEEEEKNYRQPLLLSQEEKVLFSEDMLEVFRLESELSREQLETVQVENSQLRGELEALKALKRKLDLKPAVDSDVDPDQERVGKAESGLGKITAFILDGELNPEKRNLSVKLMEALAEKVELDPVFGEFFVKVTKLTGKDKVPISDMEEILKASLKQHKIIDGGKINSLLVNDKQELRNVAEDFVEKLLELKAGKEQGTIAVSSAKASQLQSLEKEGQLM